MYYCQSNFSLLLHCSAASFTALDKNYLTPFFTSQNGDEDDEGKFDFKFFFFLYNFVILTEELMKWIGRLGSMDMTQTWGYNKI